MLFIILFNFKESLLPFYYLCKINIFVLLKLLLMSIHYNISIFMFIFTSVFT